MSRTINNREGETKRMNCGLMSTITKYRNTYDIDVEFEDKRVAKHRQYYNFTKGRILPDGYVLHRDDRMQETRVMNCGTPATIIAYRASNDIDVEFPEGKIVKGVQYNTFLNGALLPPGYREEKKREKENVVVTASNGMKMKCIAYYSQDDIDVQFEDGTIVKEKQYRAFKQGLIRNPNIKRKTKPCITEEEEYER